MTARPTASARDPPPYGEHFPFISWSLATKLRVSSVFATGLRRVLGWPRFGTYWLVLPARLPGVLRSHGPGFGEMRRPFGLVAEAEWVLLVVMVSATRHPRQGRPALPIHVLPSRHRPRRGGALTTRGHRASAAGQRELACPSDPHVA